jgi:hypothetical protein
LSTELIVLDSDDIVRSGLSGFNDKDLPQVIQGQISKLNELDTSVKKAMKAAASAKESAISAKNMSAGLGKKKVAIEELQSAGVDLAKAVTSGAEAQKISFEFQTKLAEVSKYLFGLGVSNITSNRLVVRELEMKLKGASQEELSELARQELMSVVKQLKDQEDILNKLEILSKTTKNHEMTLKDIDRQLQDQAEIDRWHSAQLENYAETSERFEEKLEAQASLGKHHSEQLHAQAKLNKLYEDQLKTQAENDKILEKKLQAQAEIDSQHSEQLKVHAEISGNLEKRLESQAEVDKLHTEQLEILFESIKKHEEQLDNLHVQNKDLNQQIKNNLKTIETQQQKINALNNEVINLKNTLNTKANTTSLKITTAIAVIGAMGAVLVTFL